MRNQGHLLYPSEHIMNIIYTLETAIINVLNNKCISKHVLEHSNYYIQISVKYF